MNAQNNPVRSARKEVSSTDFPIGQKDAIDMAMDRPLDHAAASIIVADPDTLNKEYAEALAFAEEPVEIYIHPTGQKNAPIVIDCWVNGKGAEVFVNGQWHQFGCLPIAKNVITRRKYVEVLARSKIDTINTEHENPGEAEMPKNVIRRATSANCSFQVVGDRNPKGGEWLRGLMAAKS